MKEPWWGRAAPEARDLVPVIEPELVVQLLADAAGELGILPRLQETMVQLGDVRADQTLTLADYHWQAGNQRPRASQRC